MPNVNQTPAKLTVDFTGVEGKGSGRNPHLPGGDYLTKITDVSVRSKRDDPSKKHLAWKLQILEGNAKGVGKTFIHRTSLSRDSLWSLRGFLIDLLGEEKVPQRSLDVPLEAIKRKQPQIGITLEDDEYDGHPTSKVAGTFPKSDWADLKGAAEADDEEEDEEEDEDEEEEEEAPPPKKTAKKPAKKAPVEEEDEEEDDEDEIDVDDL